MNLFKLANILDKRISALRIEPNLCTQNISPKSSCQSCLNACPTDSITIADHKIEIDDRCLECGLCSTVCPTNALSFERPSFQEIIAEVDRKCKNHAHVCLQCKKQPSNTTRASTVNVPCLGAIPREAWMTLANYENLSLYQPENGCKGCEIGTGVDIWQKELQAAEEMIGKQINRTTTIVKGKKQTDYDQSRRELFFLFGSELKSTNKLVIKEVFVEPKVPTYQEKLQDDALTKVRKEWENVSTSLVERITNENIQPYMGKRKLFVERITEEPALQEKQDIRLPSILPECNFCGACTLLCPTDALVKETVNDQTTIILHPDKCVDCHLCEEICYFEYLQLQPAANKQLLKESIVLATEKT